MVNKKLPSDYDSHFYKYYFFLQIFTSFNVVIINIMVILILQTCVATTSPCRHPAKRKLRKIKIEFLKNRSRTYSDSFNILYINEKKNYYQIDDKFKSQRTMHISWLNKNCPKYDYENPCPHYFALDVDDNRIPNVLLQAKCKCSECLQKDGNRPKHHDQTGLGCREIYHYSVVMRATKCSDEGEMLFEEVYEPISVGCACKRPKRITMSNDSIEKRIN